MESNELKQLTKKKRINFNLEKKSLVQFRFEIKSGWNSFLLYFLPQTFRCAWNLKLKLK